MTLSNILRRDVDCVFLAEYRTHAPRIQDVGEDPHTPRLQALCVAFVRAGQHRRCGVDDGLPCTQAANWLRLASNARPASATCLNRGRTDSGVPCRGRRNSANKAAHHEPVMAAHRIPCVLAHASAAGASLRAGHRTRELSLGDSGECCQARAARTVVAVYATGHHRSVVRHSDLRRSGHLRRLLRRLAPPTDGDDEPGRRRALPPSARCAAQRQRTSSALASAGSDGWLSGPSSTPSSSGASAGPASSPSTRSPLMSRG
jgi:hypothetical protein